LLHEGETEPVEIEIIRAKLEISSVLFEMRGDIAYIIISQFSENTDEELAPVIKNLDPKTRGIILDLRSNPGGLLDTVIEVTSFFLSEGTVVKVVSNQEILSTHDVRPSAVTTDLPMVVLVDQYSASGSEVLSGALQDRGRATVAGVTTFGKGSVNILRQLSDGSGLYVTTARWLTPNDRLIEGKGIDPDYEFELTGEDAIRWAIGYLTSNK
ncbi:S41 family peptidase, partial [Chloroflexota bacterium]